MLPTEEASIEVSSFDELVRIEERLYCLWQAMLYGDRMMVDHEKKLGGVAHEIWTSLSDVIKSERIRYHHIEEEMRKFKEGFAYEPREATTTSGEEPELYSLESEGDQRKRKKHHADDRRSRRGC